MYLTIYTHPVNSKTTTWHLQTNEQLFFHVEKICRVRQLKMSDKKPPRFDRSVFFIDLIPLIVPHFRFHVKSIHLKSIWFAHVFHLSTIWHVFSRCGFFVLDFTRAYQIHIYIFNMNMSKLTRRFFRLYF